MAPYCLCVDPLNNMPIKKYYVAFLLLAIFFLSACRQEVMVDINNLPNPSNPLPALKSSKESSLFDYKAQIRVDKVDANGGNIQLIYSVSVALKDRSQPVKDVVGTCYLDDSVSNITKFPFRKTFGSYLSSSPITLNDKYHTLELNLGTSIDQSLNLSKDEIEKILKVPLKVSVKWDNGQEYVEIPLEDITLTIEKK
ncbi:hypothetical protein [Guggenheimella bovis]